MGNCILTKSGRSFCGIDPTNLIARTPSLPYTATEDCIVNIYHSGYTSESFSTYINSVLVSQGIANNYESIVLKKDQKLNTDHYTGAFVGGIK